MASREFQTSVAGEELRRRMMRTYAPNVCLYTDNFLSEGCRLYSIEDVAVIEDDSRGKLLMVGRNPLIESLVPELQRRTGIELIG